MNVTEYAKHIGRSQPMVSKWLKPGGLLESAYTGKGKNIRIDVKKADKIIEKYLNISQSRKEKEETIKEVFFEDNQKMTYQDALILDKKYSAALKKLRLDRESGLLVLKADVEKEAFECGRRLRDSILSIRERLSAILAAETDEFKVYQILTKELNQALEETISKLSGG